MPEEKTNQTRSHPLDGRNARIAAIGVCIAMLSLLGFIHRDDWSGAPDTGDAVTNDAFARCLADRHGAVDQMVADGVIGPDKETLFKSRAEALCRDQNPN